MTLDRLSVDELLAEIGAKSPTPGGGAVACVTAALAAALGRMVVNYSVGKPSLAEHDALHQAALEALADLTTPARRCAWPTPTARRTGGSTRWASAITLTGSASANGRERSRRRSMRRGR